MSNAQEPLMANQYPQADAPPYHNPQYQPAYNYPSFYPSQPPPYNPQNPQGYSAYPNFENRPNPHTLSKYSQPLTCNNCGYSIYTKVRRTNGVTPWLFCGGLLFVGCWLGCCLIPFCIEDLKDVEHRCPNCNYVIGVKRLI